MSKKLYRVFFVCISLLGLTLEVHAVMGPLKVHAVCPRYFADPDDHIVYLTGSHTWADFQEQGMEGSTPNFDFPAFLDFLVENNQNFLRFWAWEHATWMPFLDKEKKVRNTPLCYPRTGPGDALDGQSKFDVNQFNPDYFNRLRERVFAAREKGIYVSVMLFQGLSVAQPKNEKIDSQKGNPWEGHPFNKKNNINGIDGDKDGNGNGSEIHTLIDPRITQLQENYVKQMIETLNGYDNLIWEIGNACGDPSLEWQNHMIQFIRDYEKGKPFQHPIWISDPLLNTDSNANRTKALFDSPADAISSPGLNGDEKKLFDFPQKKVIMARNEIYHSDAPVIDHTWVWKCFVRGFNPIVLDPYRDIRVQSPDKPVPEYDRIRKALGQTLLFSKTIQLEKMIPHNELCSTGFCLANPGQEYLAYQPESEKLFWVDLPPGTYEVNLFCPLDGKIKTSIAVQSNEQKKQLIPIFFYGDVVAYIKQVDVKRQETQEETVRNSSEESSAESNSGKSQESTTESKKTTQKGNSKKKK